MPNGGAARWDGLSDASETDCPAGIALAWAPIAGAAKLAAGFGRRPPMLVPLGIVLVAGALLAVVQVKQRADWQNALQAYRHAAGDEARRVSDQLDTKLNQIHQGLRTITMLPSVRRIDRHGDNIDEDALEAIQQIYNNLRANVAISEVYIVPSDFEPDLIDARTGEPQAPIMMFDGLIAGAAETVRSARGEAAGPPIYDAPEVEIFEYRALRAQLAWLRKTYPADDAFAHLQRPMLSTPELITCDNSVLSAPGSTGTASGSSFRCRSTILPGCSRAPSRRLSAPARCRPHLPDGNYALINNAHGYHVLPDAAGAVRTSMAQVRRHQADPALLFSAITRLRDSDPQGSWLLWSGQPDARFQDSDAAQAVRAFAWVASSLIILLAVLSLAALAGVSAHARMRAAQIEQLQSAQTAMSASEARARHLAYHDALTGLPNRALLWDRMAHVMELARRGGQGVRRALHRPRSVQGSERHLRPPGRRRADPRGRAQARGPVPQVRHAGPAGRRRVRGGAVRRGPGERRRFRRAHRRAAGQSDQALDRRDPCRLQRRRHPGPGRNDEAIDAVEALRQADLALYRAKERGRGQYAFFEAEMDAAVRMRRALQSDLRLALANDELQLVYQPQVDGTGKVVGVEALARWNHALRGTVPPSLFVPIAEECGLIVELGFFTLRQAFAQSARWPGIKIAINISAHQIRMRDFLGRVAALIEETQVDPAHFELELTEGVLIGDDTVTHATLRGLRDLGFSLALDDFGTGYSSLSYLQRYPVDKIKIDRSFITNLNTDRETGAVIAAIVKLAVALNLRVIAEGVETEEQRRALSAVGCTEVQGYLFGQPMTPEAIDALLAGGRAAEPSAAETRVPSPGARPLWPSAGRPPWRRPAHFTPRSSRSTAGKPARPPVATQGATEPVDLRPLPAIESQQDQSAGGQLGR